MNELWMINASRTALGNDPVIPEASPVKGAEAESDDENEDDQEHDPTLDLET